MKLRTTALVLCLGLSNSLAAPPEKPNLITVTKVVAQNLREEVPLAGTAEPVQESDVSSRVAGVVIEVFVDEGDWVEAGQKILSLDPDIAELAVASATAKLNEAIARHKDALRQKKEYQSLIKNKAVAATSLASAVADEEAARATIALQQAELMRNKELLSRHVLTAPFAGVVVNKLVEAGQWVKAENSAIKLVALDRIRIRASLPQRYFNSVDTTAVVRVVFDSLPEKTFSGRTTALVAVGKQSTRSFPLLITLENTQHAIAAGMSARVYVELKSSQANALMIPRDAVVLKANGSRVVWQVIETEGKLKVKPVGLVTGRPQGELVEVLESTLNAGDRVVLLGNENLRPDQIVKLSKGE